MALIPVKKVIAQFQTMWKEHWPYIWGRAEKGCVDCSGAFTYTWRLFGKSITHGSNAIARKYVKELLPVSQAKPGMAAFKSRKPSEAYYDLPDKYKPGGTAYNGDLNDYHHVGLVDENPQYVLNAQGESTGFVRSPISQKWSAVGYLKDVDYSGESPEPTPTIPDEGGEEVQTATVIRPDGAGGTYVHFRKKPAQGAAVADDVNFGETVTVLDTSTPDWAKIQYKGKTGYMMTKFLSISGDDAGGDEEATPDADWSGDTVTVKRSVLESFRETLNQILGVG